MASRLREKARPTLQDFLEDDPRVIAVEGFWALGRFEVKRGQFYRLSDPVVREFPAHFCVIVPVNQVLGEIER